MFVLPSGLNVYTNGVSSFQLVIWALVLIDRNARDTSLQGNEKGC